MQVYLPDFNRTTVDLGYIWRSTMASGTLVPFMKELALPGDTHEINLNAIGNTHPTIAPLFGSYKMQLDVYSVPIGLYQSEVITNKLEIGLDMSKVKMPVMGMYAKGHKLEDIKTQINPSSLLSYLNIVGVGRAGTKDVDYEIYREFNAVPMLAYWDIFKAYYSNKMEEYAYYIEAFIQEIRINNETSEVKLKGINAKKFGEEIEYRSTRTTTLEADILVYAETNVEFTEEEVKAVKDRITIKIDDGIEQPLDNVYDSIEVKQIQSDCVKVIARRVKDDIQRLAELTIEFIWQEQEPKEESPINLKKFELKNIDKMRDNLIKWRYEGTAFNITKDSDLEPYNSIGKSSGFPLENRVYARQYSQHMLAVKTYQSDLFNNWLNTEWIDGETGINELTKVNVEDGLKINDLILHKKLYDMLNAIAISGGSYDNWLIGVYGQERTRAINSPLYHGGLIKEITFDEVVSNSATSEQPLGTLAGKGTMTEKHKGGYIKIKTDEPSWIIGIISITPRIDYSQGNKWDVNLKTWDDFHKPQLDGIGFQDLITDQMAYFDTTIDEDKHITYNSAGKQPAWINYQTNVNVVKGNFALEDNQMYMTLNRRYEMGDNGELADLTTYIDPAKYNHVFAYTKRDAQNFWVQVKADITARRKMSANIIPNL